MYEVRKNNEIAKNILPLTLNYDTISDACLRLKKVEFLLPRYVRAIEIALFL